MDPITHAIAGMAIGMQGGESFSISNVALVASTLGAVAPDFDIVAKIWGDYTYIKQHRGFSHSLPGLVLISLVFGGLLSIFYTNYNYWEIIRWVFFGAVSHSILDIFNSYGVQILWPLNKKKWTVNLLMIFDPFIFVIGICMIIISKNRINHIVVLAFLISYIVIRFIMRRKAYNLVMNRLKRKYKKVALTVLPSTYNLFKWDFIANVPGKRIVGSTDLLRKRTHISRLLRCIKKERRDMFNNTVLGVLFKEFTPFYHIDCEIIEDKIIGRFMDLRYMVKDRFLHNGIIILSKDKKVEKAVFQPFNLSREINV